MFGRSQGFTLIEILVALTLMAIGVMSFSLNTVGIIQGQAASRNLTVAVHLAQDKLEQIQALAIDSPVCLSVKLPVCSQSEPPQNSRGTTEPKGLIFNRSWVITPDAPEPGLAKIDVTVSWNERSRKRQFKMATLVYAP